MDMMPSNSNYYRPKWICGRYSKHGKAAIVYNLLEGLSYLFEDYSALVVSYILGVPRGEALTYHRFRSKLASQKKVYSLSLRN